MNLFAMISTAASTRYTLPALVSFFAHTRLGFDDRLILINNDQAKEIAFSHPALTVVANTAPKSFAANMNSAIREAVKTGADLYFLNNDIIFTEGWQNELLGAPLGLVSPLCNQQIQYRLSGLALNRSMELDQYLGHEKELAAIVKEHQARNHGYRSVLSLPFFCIRISSVLLQKIGYLDTSFGPGGAEDNDYCLRALLAGYPINFALASYVLHFSGRSTWAGGETASQTAARVSGYTQRFKEKWGESLKSLVLDFKNEIITQDAEALQAAQRGELRRLIELLLARDNLPLPPLFLEESL